MFLYLILFLILFPIALVLVVPIGSAIGCGYLGCEVCKRVNVCGMILCGMILFCIGLSLGTALNVLVAPLVVVCGIPCFIGFFIYKKI